ncbi:MAG TPA: protein-glutamate O-methyltransferase CheR [Gemmatimonadaceae bacterium]|nr:protein-glutamate O-methyltransferase CheR [Gemmatimonadaceae bacterium]
MPAPVPDVDEPEFVALCQKIERERGFQCSSYKDTCLRRRISVRMRANGATSFAEFARIIDNDPREYDKLISTLTINVTKFFRNPETFACVASKVIPQLWETSHRSLRVWSAGCATGEEAYSLAVLFAEHAQMKDETDRLARVRVLGSDIDADALAFATRGRYSAPAFADTTPAVRDRYFPIEDGMHSASPEIRRLVRFERQDILSPLTPGVKMHMILCRNVIIYFNRDTQETLFHRFHELLQPGGFLVLGKVETLLGKTREMFAPVSSRDRVFRRL